MEAHEPKQVIVVRRDLNMRKGKMVAQGSHASVASILLIQEHITRDPIHRWAAPARQWLAGQFSKICVRVDDETELMRIHGEAHRAGLPVALVTDSGRTEFHGVPTRTCLAIGPCLSEDVDHITGTLRLL